MNSVTKLMNFEYGHRILNHPGKCKRLHRHSGRVEFTLGAAVSRETGMVIDFGYINDVIGDWIKKVLDHNPILQVGDPLLESLDPEHVVITKYPPTAETISEIIRDQGVKELKPYYETITNDESFIEVKMWETEDSYATCSCSLTEE